MEKTIRQEKVAAVEQIKSKVDENLLTVYADYRGLSVAQMNQLRSILRANSADIKVYKNTFSRLALDELNISYKKEILVGPTAVITVKADPTQTAKELVKFADDTKILQIKGGVFNKQCVDAKLVKTLASLPSREELIAKAIGSIKAPLSGLVMTLSNPINGFINCLNSIKDRK